MTRDTGGLFGVAKPKDKTKCTADGCTKTNREECGRVDCGNRRHLTAHPGLGTEYAPIAGTRKKPKISDF